MSQYPKSWLFGIGLIFVFLTVFFVAVFPVRNDNDVWWHLKTGQWLLENEFFPEKDVFTYAGEDSQWANHEWLADILMYKTYEAVGIHGLVILKSILLGAAFAMAAWLGWRRSHDVGFPLLFALIGGIASRYAIHPRPPIITYFIFSIYLHLVWNLREGRHVAQSLTALFFMTIAWINLHGGGILSFVVLGLVAVGTGAEWAWAGWVHRDGADLNRHRKRTLVLFLATALAFVSTLINPFHIHIHMLTAKIMRDTELVRLIIELQTPNMHFAKGYEALLLATILLLGIRVRRTGFADVLMILFFFHQSINHVRHLPFYGLIATPILAPIAAEWVREISGGNEAAVSSRLRKILDWAVYLFFIGLCLFRSIQDYQRNWMLLMRLEHGYDPEGFPVGASDFIEREGLDGRMYNEINFAGYLIWRFSPELGKVFTDSRFDIYGSQFQKQSDAIRDAALGDSLWRGFLEPTLATLSRGIPEDRRIAQAERYVSSLPPAEWKRGIEDYLRRIPEDDWKQSLREYLEECIRFVGRGRQPPPIWRFLLKRWDMSYLILQTNSRLFFALHHGDDTWVPPDFDPGAYPRWQEAYYDRNYAVFIKDQRP